VRGKRACTVRGGADRKGQLLYLAGGLLHSGRGGWKRATKHLASRLLHYNRHRRNLPKTHWLDAACVGASTPDDLDVAIDSVLLIASKGHGNRQMCRTDKHGFPRRHVPRQKQWFGFRTGDLVKEVVPIGKYAGTLVGRITILYRPIFRLNGIDVHPKYLRRVGCADGYAYQSRTAAGTAINREQTPCLSPFSHSPAS
jgi:hypothetical protein